MATKADQRQSLDGDLLIAAKDDSAEARRLQRAAKAGRLIRVAERIYVKAGTADEISHRVRSHWQTIVGQLYPSAVVSHLSALSSGITPEGLLTLSHPTIYNRARTLAGGLHVVLIKGPTQMPEDLALGKSGLFWSSRPRMLLENLGISRTLPPRRAGRDKVEEQLINILNASGETELNKVREKARELIVPLDAAKEFQQLDSLIGALLGTHASGKLHTRMGQLVAAGTPVDAERMTRFNALANALRSTVVPAITDTAPSGAAQINFAFLESYFSNYVEGTKFSIEEAEEIVLKNKIITNRPKDSHDVLGVFKIATTPRYRATLPAPGEPFVAGLLERHRLMLENRPEANPGELKLEMNYAGTTEFVAPGLVRGTLQESSTIALSIPEGLARAIFYAFSIAEVHPFTDGNGRTSRLIMNAELSRVGNSRIIIPTLYHPQYIDCLKALTKDNDPRPFIKAIVQMARWSAEFEYSLLPDLLKAMTVSNAFEESPTRFKLKNADGSALRG